MWPSQSNGNNGPNGPPQSGPANNQQSPGWAPPPPNQQYAPPRPNQIPPLASALTPQQQDHYRSLPAPAPMYPAGPYPPHMAGYPPAQPAPRQRTAIACRYCRRRKIRCSGFEHSEDGKCTNCQRFSQECVFTPVSAQTQAFVPAHAVYRGQNPPPNVTVYGAFGQPLPEYGAYPPRQQGPPGQPGQYPQPPAGYQQPPMYGQPPQPHGTPGSNSGRKRSNDEPHTPTLAPPNPAQQREGQHAPPYPYADPSGQPHDMRDHESVMAAASAAAAAARNHEARRNGGTRDVGVQVDLLNGPPEQAS